MRTLEEIQNARKLYLKRLAKETDPVQRRALQFGDALLRWIVDLDVNGIIAAPDIVDRPASSGTPDKAEQ